ncbi:MAG: MerR family transcriptional regulator [Eubacteriales bacterium]|nr:MerR family transcriptional regulator [Eubacteriales bacterium]
MLNSRRVKTMLMNELREKTALSRKAIEYYEEKGLISPKRDANNYRLYSEEALNRLNRISLYRKLGCSIEEIKGILEDEGNSKLAAIIREREIKDEIEYKKTKILKSLLSGENAETLKEELEHIDRRENIYESLCRIFPGYTGQALFIAYKDFLDEKLKPENQKYFDLFIDFLDNLPALPISEEEAEIIEKAAQGISVSTLKQVNADKIKAVEDYDKWLKDNKETIEKYIEYKKSDEYKNNPVIKIQGKIKAFMQENNYYATAIPLIRKFSPSYDEYYKKMLKANENLIKHTNL